MKNISFNIGFHECYLQYHVFRGTSATESIQNLRIVPFLLLLILSEFCSTFLIIPVELDLQRQQFKMYEQCMYELHKVCDYYVARINTSNIKSFMKTGDCAYLYSRKLIQRFNYFRLSSNVI